MLEPVSPNNPIAKFFNAIPFIMQVVIGLILGVILAMIIPGDKTVLPAFGSLFVSALKAMAPILVFVLVSSAIAGHNKGTKTNMKPVILVYFFSMIFASILALSMSYAFPVTFPALADAASEVSPPQGISEVLLNFIMQAVDNPVNALIKGNYVAILVWGIAFGLMFRVAHEPTKLVLDDLAQTVAGVVRIVIRFAPLGVMGLVYSSCTQEGGFANLLNYVQVVLVLVATMLLIAFVLNPLLAFIVCRKNPYPLIFTSITQSAVTAFFTRSSAANIPVNLALCERLNLPKETYAISIPLGCTINMSGAAVTIVIMTMAAVRTLGIEVDFASALLMCIASVLCACGTSGIAGGSLMLIPLACSIFGIGNDIAMQVVGIGFIIGVIQDSTETALNSSSDVVFTAVACRQIEVPKE
ncbi:serine/threonine transporter SstT [Anaerobiospirillum sp. NML120448]|uniref:serine/threonine transporter SstT n=1 Tax=Anaerobiospirillum sp. NML120448 TaxID=2932816 RepID=UPI001FF6CEC9|nr:serine/threonine transporter SstT [Anaerobiospirillum sp. NML120448]MCK0513742.1 serine/threonine transporter SstT [Anaerobiospirillum sp. NML120448]